MSLKTSDGKPKSVLKTSDVKIRFKDDPEIMPPLSSDIILKWSSLSFTVQIKSGWFEKPTSKLILQPQSCEVHGGELVALMGPSG